MKFKDWKEWYKTIPKGFKWFFWLVLLRPLFENFYYLKEVSPFLSPLYIVGVLTPLVIFISIGNLRKPTQSVIDVNFRVYSVFTVAGIIVMAISGIALLHFWTIILKISLIIYLFFFLRHFIRSRKDLDGILQTFLYSSIVVVVIFIYEMIVHPLNMVHTRGIERFQGSYADVFNYATYVSLATLINYYFLLSSHSNLSRSARIRNVVINIVLGTLMLVKMSHVASDVVFLALNLLYFVIILKKNFFGAFVIAAGVVYIVYSFGQETIDNNIMPLIQTDVDVASGEGEETSYLHGRVGRWERITDIFNNSSLASQLFGLPFTGELPFAFITGGVHNDFLRNLLCVGYVGLACYLLLLFNLFKRIIKEQSGILYVGMGGLGALVLYSVTVVPTIYPAFLYIILSIFAYFSIPENVLRKVEIAEQKKMAA